MNPEAIEAAAAASWVEMNGEPWEAADEGDKAAYLADARVMLEAAAPHLIREQALSQMRSLPWFEDLVMAEALAYHSGGNCRFETEARAAELEAAAEALAPNPAMVGYESLGIDRAKIRLRRRAAAIRAGAE